MFLSILLTLFCSTDALNRVYTNVRDTTFEPGEKISMKWWFEVGVDSEMLTMKCGKKNDSTMRRSSSDDSEEDIIVLAEITRGRTTPNIVLAQPLPAMFAGRVRLEDRSRTGLTITIDPLRESDAGQYLCLLRVHDSNLFQVTTTRSAVGRLSIARTGASTDKSKDQIKVVAIIFGVMAVIVAFIIIGVFCYRRKTRTGNSDWTKPGSLRNNSGTDSLRSSISTPKNLKVNDDGKQYATVEVVSTPAEALMGKKVVYVDENSTGFV